MEYSKNYQLKRLILAVILSLSCALFLSYLAYSQALESLTGQLQELQLLIAKQTAAGFEKDIKKLVREIELLSEISFVVDLDIDEATKALATTYEHIKEANITDMAILNSAGIVEIALIAKELSGSDFSFRKYFIKAKSQINNNPTYEFITFRGVDKGNKGVVIAMPIFHPKKGFNGVVILVMKIEDFIANSLPKEKAGHTILVLEDDGNILYYPTQKSGTNIKSISNISPAFLNFFKRTISDKESYVEYISESGKKMIAAAYTANIAEQKWIVGVTAPKQIIEASIVQFNKKYIGATSFIILLIIAGAGFVVYAVVGLNEKLQKEVAERKLAEDKTRTQNEFLNCVIESIPHPFYVVDIHNHKILMANSEAAPNDVWQGETCYSLTHNCETPCDADEHPCPLEEVKRSHKPVVVEHVHINSEGHKQNIEVHGYPIFDENSELVQMIEYFIDITERKNMEKQREQLIFELQESLEKVKLLSGFIPICASCKRIRDDKGFWSQVEAYIMEHSEAKFSHGICPECKKKLYPEL